MMRLGVIANTHGWLDLAVLEIFAGVDMVLIAGDIGRLAVVEALAGLAPVHAVRGNNDLRGECATLPDELAVDLAGYRTRLSHYRESARVDSDIAVFGHSHRQVWETRDGQYLLNPGAAGRQGFHHERSVAILDLGGERPAARHIALGPRSRGGGPARRS